MSEMIPAMLTIKETANKTGLSYEYIRKLCIQEKIVFVRSGRKYLVNFDRFMDFLNTGEASHGEGEGETHDRLN